jgi:hypothetical protein
MAVAELRSASPLHSRCGTSRRTIFDAGRLAGGGREQSEEKKSVRGPASIITLRSEPGDAVQLADLHPVECSSLVRVGGTNDGGYVVPMEAVKAVGALLSFGLSHDWTFERDFERHNAKAPIHCYDHTVSALTTVPYSFGQLARFVVRRKTRYLRKTLAWLDYLAFFRGKNVHFRERIWRDDSDGSATIADAFGRLPAHCPVFVKMDIEGSEYRVVDDLLARAEAIVAMTIEFHAVDIAPGLFNETIAKIKRDFHIVHIHGNNMGGLAPFHFPVSPEITFLNKRFFNATPTPSRLAYPVAGLDRPNHPDLPEFGFEFGTR